MVPPTMCQAIAICRGNDCEERVLVHSLHGLHHKHGRVPSRYRNVHERMKDTTGTILTLPLHGGPCLLGIVEPRTAIVLPPAPIVNMAKEKLLHFEHWFASGLVTSCTGALRTWFAALHHELLKNTFNSTMPHVCASKGRSGKASGLRCPPEVGDDLVSTRGDLTSGPHAVRRMYAAIGR